MKYNSRRNWPRIVICHSLSLSLFMILYYLQRHQHANPNTATSSLPTFLVGLGRPTAEDGVAVDTAVEVTPTNADYHSYLMDARRAVRDRFEATRCWQYDYDGLNPPPTSLTSKGQLQNSNNNTVCDTSHEDSNPADRSATPAGSDSNRGTPSASGPVSLTDDEDKEFWALMVADDNNKRLQHAIKRLKHGDDMSLSSGGNLSWTSSHGDVGSPRADDIDHSCNTLGMEF